VSVDIMREWSFRGRSWMDLTDLNAPWHAWYDNAWQPHRHRTTGTSIATRLPKDQAALRPFAAQPYEDLQHGSCDQPP
jgi:hypothetical protein